MERGSPVHFMAELPSIIDFPPAPKLNIFGELARANASPAELNGEALFNGIARRSPFHPAPYYTDNSVHNLGVERSYKPRMING